MTGAASREAPGASDLRAAALKLLARREHARAELQAKLYRRFGGDRRSDAAAESADVADVADVADLAAVGEGAVQPGAVDGSARVPSLADLVDQVLDELAAEGLQSERRTAEALVEVRLRRGQGPLRIRDELRRAGLDGYAEEFLAAADEAWVERARTSVVARFGADQPADVREWGRRARFLSRRGFPNGVVARALGEMPSPG